MPALTMPPEDGTFFCCQHSRSVEEQLFASVKPNRIWFLLEYPYPWGARAFDESELSAPVKRYLSNLLAETPGSKLLFIKNQDSLFSDKIAFFVGIGNEDRPALYRFQLDDYEDLVDLDVRSFLSSGGFPAGSTYEQSIYLVCTNGKRDQCCAKYGLDVYNHLAEYQHRVEDPAETVWQTSHVGGHRFAANVVVLPHGIYFGRLTGGEARILMDAYQSGEILLDKYRGRACYPPAVQAGEYFLRKHTGEVHIGAYRHTRTEEIASDQWSLEFASVPEGQAYRLVIRSEPSDAGIFKSCADEAGVAIAQYRLIKIDHATVQKS